MKALRVLVEKFPILLEATGNSPDVVASNIYVKNAHAALANAAKLTKGHSGNS